MIFINYDNIINYQIWDPVIDKIIITLHINFDENFDKIAVDIENFNIDVN